MSQRGPWLWQHEGARAFSAAADVSNVGTERLEELRDEADRLVRAYPSEPLSLLLPELVELQEQTFTLLEAGNGQDRHETCTSSAAWRPGCSPKPAMTSATRTTR